MRQHERGDPRGASVVAAKKPINAGENRCPNEVGREAMRVRIRNEIERRDCRDAGHYADLLDSKEEQHGPNAVGELRRKHQGSQRRTWCDFLRSECNSKVTEEHPLPRSRNCPAAKRFHWPESASFSRCAFPDGPLGNSATNRRNFGVL